MEIAKKSEHTASIEASTFILLYFLLLTFGTCAIDLQYFYVSVCYRASCYIPHLLVPKGKSEARCEINGRRIGYPLPFICATSSIQEPSTPPEEEEPDDEESQKEEEKKQPLAVIPYVSAWCE